MPAGALSQFLPPKHPSTGNNRQIGIHQSKRDTCHKSEPLDPPRYDYEAKTLAMKR